MTDQERTHAAAIESIFSAVMLLAGIILITVGGFAGTIGLVLIIVGAAGAAHAVLLRLGLVDLPGEHRDRRELHDHLRRRTTQDGSRRGASGQLARRSTPRANRHRV